MTEPAAILATYSDMRLIRGRKVAQLIFEVPIENASKVFYALGMPNPAEELWCGIARVQKQDSGPGPTPGPERAEGDRAQVAAPSVPKPNSTRAVMMAKDEMFRDYIRVHKNDPMPSEADADEWIKFDCGVTSKRDLNNPPGSIAFDRLRREFNSWRLANQ